MSFHQSLEDLLSVQDNLDDREYHSDTESELDQRRPANTPQHGRSTPRRRQGIDLDEQVVPSLRAQDLAGRIRSYQGLLWRRNTKGRGRGWTRGWFKVSPGHNRPHIYYLSQSKSTPKKQTDLEKRLITIPKSNPNLTVEPLSMDPSSNNFTSFTISDSKTGELLATFRADDIVQQRNFMVSLGGQGPGLFTQDEVATAVGSNIERAASSFDVTDGSLKELALRQQKELDKQMSATSITDVKLVPSYDYTMKAMSAEYYLSDCSMDDKYQAVLPPSVQLSKTLPSYHQLPDPPESRKKSLLRREHNDTFLPPHGPPVCSIISLGYGKEVDLNPYQQAVWCMDTNIHYCLDHVKKLTFTREPRLSSPTFKAAVTKKELSCKNSPTPPNLGSLILNENSSYVRFAGERAATKSHGLVINASGTDGKPGTSGHKGNGGIERVICDHLDNRNDGRSGSDGGHGTNGKEGRDGANGQNLIVNLTGDATCLDVSIPGCCSTVANLGGDLCEEVVLVNCRGGDGGDGGNGGDGGDGGDGEDGKKGDQESDGGHGGDGGAGGQGGSGGRGGSAGSGGQCMIQTTDSRLLILVEADCRAGKSGNGGRGGKGGEGGKRGFGGEGGIWEELDTSDPTHSEHVTVTGMRGKPGTAGSSGVNGEQGSNGPDGKDGVILWVVKNKGGEILHSSNARYEAEVISFEVSSVHGSDTTFGTPNQRISISEVTIVNNGGLPLPSGAILSFPSTETVLFEPTTFTLPEIAVNETFVVPTNFHGRIFDVASPNSMGPLNSEANFSSKITLLGRQFEKSVLKRTLTITYPLKISFALSRKTVSRGETTTLEIGIENTSRQVYGCSGDSKGSAWIQVHMDSRLIPLGVLASGLPTYTQQQVTEESLPYQVTFDPKIPDSMYIKIKEIHPGEVLAVPIAVHMESYAELYDVCVWQADLWLRGKLIEYKTQEIRVSPAYSPPSSPSQLGDVLMITNDKMKQDELQFWRRIFEFLGVSVDYWDAGYKPQSLNTSNPQETSLELGQSLTPQETEHPAPAFSSRFPHLGSMYSGKMIIYPHCTLEQVPVDCILSHFRGPTQGEHWKHLNSSMLLFLDPTFPDSLELYTYKHTGHSRLLRHLCSQEKHLKLPKDAYTGHHLIAPGTLISSDRSSRQAEKTTMKKLEKEVPSQAVALSNSTSNIQHSGLFKYSYGAMHVRRCPLSRSCNFQCVDGPNGNLTTMGTDDPLLTTSSKSIPLGSKFGQVFLTVLSGLPLHCKLSVLKKTENKNSSDYVEFYLPNGLKLTKGDLAAICIAHSVADELYNCTGEASHMTYVAKDLDLSKALLRNGKKEQISQMMDLIKREVAERRKALNIPPVVQAANKINELCNSWTYRGETPHPPTLRQCSQQIFTSSVSLTSVTSTCSGTTPSCAEPAESVRLPSLRLLQDSSRVLRSHQHFIDQDKYNISDVM